MRSTIRNVAARTATVLVFALTATVVALMAPPAAQARVIDCVVQPQPPQGGWGATAPAHEVGHRPEQLARAIQNEPAHQEERTGWPPSPRP
jgi:hypothetical protein